VLEQLLAGAVPEEELTGLWEHLGGCADCSAALRAKADDPELGDWARAYGLTASPAPRDPELDRFLQSLRARSVPPVPATGNDAAAPEVSLAFLGPPQQAGDLGMLGTYRILETLGHGAMGVVLKAYDSSLQRTVALKVLRPDRADEQARARFVREARAAAGLAQEHVVPVHAVATPPEGPPYLVMQYIAGPTLLERIQRERRLPPREAARLCCQVAEGLAAAHRAGLVHRDVKPSNILCEAATGRALLTDFGLARLSTVPGGSTQEGTILGTPEYMSPEQVRAERVDGRSDVYSLGVTLYEALTGELPFRGLSYLVLQQIVHDPPLVPRRLNDRVPRDLETICLKCLEKEPRGRYPSADALAEDLRRFLNGQPILARPTPAWERALKWARRRPAIAGLLAGLVVVTALGFAGVTWQWRQAEGARRVAEAAREEAETAREEAETTLYFSRIGEARRSWQTHDVGGAVQLLDLCCPREGRADLRGWEWHYLHRLCHADLFTLRGHRQWVYSLAFSPDGRRLASAAGDPYASHTPGELKLWDVATGRQLLTGRGPTRAVFSVAFSPDGRRLASAGGDLRNKTAPGEVKVWDAATGEELLALQGHSGPVWGVAFSSDGSCLASSGHDQTVRVWEATTGRALLTLKGAGESTAVAFAPDGRRLASVGEGVTIQVWEVSTGRPLQRWRGHTGAITTLAFSPDGVHVASAGYDQSVRLWDAVTGRPLQSFHGHAGCVWSVAFSPDGTRLTSAGADSTVRLWDVRTGAELLNLRGHTWAARGVAFSPDGRRLASASQDQTVKLWDATRNPQALTVRKPDGFLNEVAFRADGRYLVSARGPGDAVGWLKAWDATSGVAQSEQPIDVAAWYEWPFAYLAFRADGERLAAASGTDKRMVKVWEVATGRELLALHGHTLPVTNVAFSGDGRRLASAAVPDAKHDGPNEVRLWDATTGAALVRFHGHERAITSLALSPDGRRLASASRDETVKVWDATTGQELFTLYGHRGAVGSVAFSPEGRRLASAGYLDEGVRLWDATTGRALHTLHGPAQATHVTFSPDGRRLAAAGADLVKLWDATTGQEAFTLRGLTGSRPDDFSFNLRVVFSPDGQRLATTNWDHSIHIWDGSARRPAARLDMPAPTARAWHQAAAADSEHAQHWFAAAFHLSCLVDGEPDDARLRVRRGRAYAELEQWDKAAADYAHAVARQPDDPQLWCAHACLRLQGGDLEGYRAACRRLLERWSQTPDPDTGCRIVWTCALLPQTVADPRCLVAWAEQAVARRPRTHECLYTLGAAYYRCGRFPEAILWLTAAIETRPRWGAHLSAWLLRALAQHRIGQTAGAGPQLAQVLADPGAMLDQEDFRNGAATPLSWNERLEFGLLRREAQQELNRTRPKE
jgi:WD40 repeat protein